MGSCDMEDRSGIFLLPTAGTDVAGAGTGRGFFPLLQWISIRRTRKKLRDPYFGSAAIQTLTIFRLQQFSMEKYLYMTCGYLYDEEKGAAPSVPAGTPFDKIPDTWICPMCGASKKFFAKRG